ncbi:MAG: hypothetical protein AAF958_09840 [Planctomycetota bacterium]
MNEPYRLRYTNQIVGAFLILLLLFVILIASVLVRANPVFDRSERIEFRISQDQLGDLYEGAEVMRLGRRAGQVETIRYAEEQGDQITIELAVDPEVARQWNGRAELHVERKFGVGSPILVIRRGRADPEPADAEDDSVRFFGETDRLDQMASQVQSVSDSVSRIERQLTPTLQSIRDSSEDLSESLNQSIRPASDRTAAAMTSVQQSSDVLRPETLATLKAFRESTQALERQIGQLTTEVQSLVRGDLRETLGDVRSAAIESRDAAYSVRETSEQTNRRVAETLQDIQTSAGEVTRLARQSSIVVGILREEAEELPGTAKAIRRSAQDAEALVEDINGHWLLRGKQQTLSGDRQIAPPSLNPSSGSWGGSR